MKLQVVNSASNREVMEKPTAVVNPPLFIEANTKTVSLSHLKQDCTIPVFAKDNEVTISHQDFIESMQGCTSQFFPQEELSSSQIRVSHIIKGRIPEAIKKPASELLPHEKTIYYERMAFVIDIPNIRETVAGNTLSLSVGGVRAYNQENLYSKKTIEKFKVFIGFKNWICTNLCISTDGFSEEIRVSSIQELQEKITVLLSSYNMERHLSQMNALQQQVLTESQLNTIAKDYYEDSSFCRDEAGNINLWNVYNLFTGANKSSYIDSFLSKNVNAHNFTNSISEALGNSDYHWFLS